MTRNEWLILGGAGILGFYFYKKSQAVPVAASSIKTALTTPTALNPANIAAIGADANTIWSAIQGMFSTPSTPLTTGGSVLNDTWGSTPINALMNAPVVPNPLTTNPFSVNGYPRSNASRFLGNTLQPDMVPDLIDVPDYRTSMSGGQNLPGRPNPATLARPRY